MIYGIIQFTTHDGIYDVVEFIHLFAVSFLASYAALWLELIEGIIDRLYLLLYEKVYTNTENDTVTSDADSGNSTSTVS